MEIKILQITETTLRSKPLGLATKAWIYIRYKSLFEETRDYCFCTQVPGQDACCEIEVQGNNASWSLVKPHLTACDNVTEVLNSLRRANPDTCMALGKYLRGSRLVIHPLWRKVRGVKWDDMVFSKRSLLRFLNLVLSQARRKVPKTLFKGLGSSKRALGPLGVSFVSGCISAIAGPCRYGTTDHSEDLQDHWRELFPNPRKHLSPAAEDRLAAGKAAGVRSGPAS